MPPKIGKDEELLALARTLRGTPWCEEYEKMISGMMYSPIVPELSQGRHQARCLAYKLNNLDPSTEPYDALPKTQMKLLGDICGKVGAGTFAEPPFYPDYGCNIILGKNCFLNMGVTILDTSLVIIGDRVQIGSGVKIFSAGHETSVLSRVKFVEWGLPVRIEDDCWIGGGATILPGVTIGRGTTIGANAVVSRDIPPYSVAVGLPARVVKTIPSLEEEMADPKNPYNALSSPEPFS